MPLCIVLAHGSPAEDATRDTLVRLVDIFALERYSPTQVVRVESGAIPHSHPVLTLNTAYRHDPIGLLASYLHEQMHWVLAKRGRLVDAESLKGGLEAAYPAMPVAPPDGAGDSASTYLHIAVCAVELDALVSLVGSAAAERVIRARAARFYRAVYTLVLDRRIEILERLAEWGGGWFWRPGCIG